jgi:hypothetical protein
MTGDDMTNSAADHGYSNQPPPRTVRIGDTFRLRCALGVYESRVLRPHHDAGYYETVFERWVTPVEPFRQGKIGSIEILARSAILEAKYAP